MLDVEEDNGGFVVYGAILDCQQEKNNSFF